MSCKDKRDQFIDICKGIGILCVYYGHTALWGTCPSRIVFSFHMPLFFLLSGMCFNPGKIENVMSLFRKVWKNLLLPYCVFVVIGKMLCWNVAIPKLFNNPIKEIWYIIQGEGSYSVWFLMCLAVVQVVAWIVSRSNAPIVRICWMIPGLCLLIGGGFLMTLQGGCLLSLQAYPLRCCSLGLGCMASESLII